MQLNNLLRKNQQVLGPKIPCPYRHLVIKIMINIHELFILLTLLEIRHPWDL